MKPITFQLNGSARSVWVEPNETLLDVLRGKLGIKTPKEGCGRGDCGACTVLLDGKAVRSCLILAVEVEGQSVTTLEGLVRKVRPHCKKHLLKTTSFSADFVRRELYSPRRPCWPKIRSHLKQRCARHWLAICAAAPAMSPS